MTDSGIRTEDGNSIEDTPFHGRKIIAGSVRDGSAALIVEGNEVWFQDGTGWRNLATSSLPLNCTIIVDNTKVLVGTAEARLAWVAGDRFSKPALETNGVGLGSSDGEAPGKPVVDGLEFIESFDAIPERKEWNTPWGGPPDTRSLALAPDGTLYANIHVGWIAKSTDQGGSWHCTRNGLEKDVHQVAAHPDDPDTVFAATATGFHISRDKGESFDCKPGNMPYLYQRACVCFPGSETYLVSTSRGPHGQADALLFRTENGGETWDLVDGLPESIKDNIDTFHVAVVDKNRAYVAVDNTSLFSSEDSGKTWTRIPKDFPGIHAIIVPGR